MNYRQSSPPDHLLIVGFGSHVVGMSVRDGSRVWAYEFNGGNVRIVVEGDRVYALGLELVCLDYATGRPVWRQPDLPISGSNWTLLVHGDSVVVGSRGEVACFEPETGKLRWHEGFQGMGVGCVAIGFPGKSVQGDLDH